MNPLGSYVRRPALFVLQDIVNIPVRPRQKRLLEIFPVHEVLNWSSCATQIYHGGLC
jgi:hypothetical protein